MVKVRMSVPYRHSNSILLTNKCCCSLASLSLRLLHFSQYSTATTHSCWFICCVYSNIWNTKKNSFYWKFLERLHVPTEKYTSKLQFTFILPNVCPYAIRYESKHRSHFSDTKCYCNEYKQTPNSPNIENMRNRDGMRQIGEWMVTEHWIKIHGLRLLLVDSTTEIKTFFMQTGGFNWNWCDQLNRRKKKKYRNNETKTLIYTRQNKSKTK